MEKRRGGEPVQGLGDLDQVEAVTDQRLGLGLGGKQFETLLVGAGT
mgnify:CR=1 FL=1